MKPSHCLKVVVVLIAFLHTYVNSYSQYTLTKDSLAFSYLNDTLRIAPDGKAPEFGIATNQFGIPVDEFYGSGYKLENFKLFGHLVDSFFINHQIHMVHFLLVNGKRADLSFRSGNGIFTGTELWEYSDGYLVDSLEIRMQITGNPGQRAFKWQYISTSGTVSSDPSEFEIVVSEGAGSIRVHYGIQQNGWFSNGPQLQVPYYQSRVALVSPKHNSRVSYRQAGSILLAEDLSTNSVIDGLRFELSLAGHCTNGVMDGDETGIDCGGSGCQPCSCSDGIQNNTETDVDCGGRYCRDCPTGAFPICPRNDTLSKDTVTWSGGNKFFAVKLGSEVVVDGLTPNSTYEFKYISALSFPNTPAVFRPSDGEELEFGGSFGPNGFGQNTHQALIANTDSTQQLFFRYFNWIICDTVSLIDSLVVRVSLVSDSSAGKTYSQKPKICMVTYDSIFQTDVVAYEDILENETDTILYAITGNPVTNFLSAHFLDLDTGEAYFARLDTNTRGAHAIYEWDSPRMYNMMFLNDGGVRSDVSGPHSIIAVDAQLAPDSSAVHVAWTPYKGFKHTEYNVYRQMSGDSISTYLGSVPFSQTWFVDTAFPIGVVEYFVALPKVGGCNTSRAATKRNYNASRSRNAAVPTGLVAPPPDTTGLESAKQLLGLRIFPNPTSSFFELEDPETLAVSFAILDGLGRVVEERKSYLNEAVDVRHLEHGIYFVRIRQRDNSSTTLKLIIQ